MATKIFGNINSALSALQSGETLVESVHLNYVFLRIPSQAILYFSRILLGVKNDLSQARHEIRLEIGVVRYFFDRTF